jgi:hypothetical protein
VGEYLREKVSILKINSAPTTSLATLRNNANLSIKAIEGLAARKWRRRWKARGRNNTGHCQSNGRAMAAHGALMAITISSR